MGSVPKEIRMTGIYIGSTTHRAGKSLLAFSVGVLLQRAGFRVGYMKPIGRIAQTVDEVVGDVDAMVAQELIGQYAAPDVLSPVMMPKNLHSLAIFEGTRKSGNTLACIAKAYNQLAEEKDAMVVCGTGTFPATGQFCEADGLAITRHLRLKTVLIERYNGRINYDALLYLKSILGDDLLGVVLNDVPVEETVEATRLLIPYLAHWGITTLGVIPREPRLSAIRISELAQGLSGWIVAGNRNASRCVESFFIGTMQVDNFMTHLRCHQDSAVIVGGDRTDLQLAALYTSCPCLVLTGNFTPTELIRTRAESMGVPLICVREHAYTVARNMAAIIKGRKLRDLFQINLGISLVERTVDMHKVSGSVGMP